MTWEAFWQFLPLPLYAGWLLWGFYASARWIDYREKWHKARGQKDFDLPLIIYISVVCTWVTGPILPLVCHPGDIETMGPINGDDL